MRIAGTRADGAYYLVFGGGLAVILKGDRVSPTIDTLVAERHGPWTPWTDNGFEVRRRLQAKADLAHVVPLAQLVNLGLSYDEQRERVTQALRQRLGYGSSPYPMPMDGPYIPTGGLGDDWVVYQMQGKYYGLPYTIDDTGLVSFDGEATEVHQTWESLDESVEFPEDADDVDIDLKGKKVQLKHSPWFKNFMADKKKKLSAKVSANADRYQALWVSAHLPISLAEGGAHPFTYCKEVIVPAMAKDGKEPDDPEAFCSWWKNSGPGSE